MDRSADRPAGATRRGILAVGAFLIFGTVAASLAGITLVWVGTALDRILSLNLRAYGELAPYGRAIGIPFLFMGAALAASATGWFKQRVWGWRLTVAIITTQVIGDLVNLVMRRLLEGILG